MRINTRYLEINIGKHPYRIILKFHPSSKWYNKDYKKFVKLAGTNSEFPIKDNYPCLYDKTDEAGDNHSHYFIQDLYVAQLIHNSNPVRHVDVGSRIDGFVAHVASFRKIELIDVRKLDSTIKNVIFTQADLMDEKSIPYDYCDSVSSLHALEHFGLGRYGDHIDPMGHIKGFNNIAKMLKKGGKFYFSVPFGRQRIDFNAHRVFGMPYLVSLVTEKFDIFSFSYIDDSSILHTEVELNPDIIDRSFGCDKGCAIFVLEKK